jgi:hypothetical protein
MGPPGSLGRRGCRPVSHVRENKIQELERLLGGRLLKPRFSVEPSTPRAPKNSPGRALAAKGKFPVKAVAETNGVLGTTSRSSSAGPIAHDDGGMLARLTPNHCPRLGPVGGSWRPMTCGSTGLAGGV